MSIEADVIVLGLGAGGEDLSLQLLDAGLDVIGIEAQLLGGECPYWACIPSKMMIRSANLLQEARRVAEMAGTAEVTPDWGLVAQRIRDEATGGWDDSYAVERFEAKGGRFVRGLGSLTGPRTVAVDGQEFTAGRGIVIGTGSRPRIPDIPGLSEVGYWISRDVIAATDLPESLIVLGGGSVGCELGQVLARFGVEVTIVEGRDRLMSAGEPEASEIVRTVFEAEGIAVHTGAGAERVERRGESTAVLLEGGRELVAQRLLVASGRIVDVSELGLDAAGVDHSSGFIEVDDHLRAADGIWALGDVAGKGMFTHVALYHAAIIAADIVGLDPPPADHSALPAVTFTDPEVGAVGLTEAEAREAGLDVLVATKQLPATFRAWLHSPGNDGVIKLVIDRNQGVLVGATAAGPHGGEVLGMLSLAVHARIPIAQLQHMIYAYLTFYGAIGEALGAYGRGTGKVLDPTYAMPEGLDVVGR